VADFYEIDFLPVHTSKSGDAIVIRYQIGNTWSLHLVDGGYASTAPDVANHIRKYYGTNLINYMVVTHPDQDHVEGLAPILEEFDVGELWMLRPWNYVEYLVQHVARYNSARALRDRLRKDYPYIEAVEKIALRKQVSIYEPFQGQRIGPFTVLAPSRARYLQLILDSDKTPQQAAGSPGILSELMKAAAPVIQHQGGMGERAFLLRRYQCRE
jgi:hypothetical protein